MSMMMKTLRTVGAASVLVGGLFHLAGPAVFDLPLIGKCYEPNLEFRCWPCYRSKALWLGCRPLRRTRTWF
jgi:hypothetical protein